MTKCERVMRRGRRDNCLVGNTRLKPALLIGFPALNRSMWAGDTEHPSSGCQIESKCPHLLSGKQRWGDLSKQSQR